ncbi:MAG TPA: family 43 glycosylhydrolase [Puia sp.]|jgi:beta-fructofuranosidase
MKLLLPGRIKILLGLLCCIVVRPAGVCAHGFAAEPDTAGRIAAVAGPGGLVELFYVKKNHVLYRQMERRADDRPGPGYMSWGAAVRLAGGVRAVSAAPDAKDGIRVHYLAGIPAVEESGRRADSCYFGSGSGYGKLFYFDDRDHLFYNSEYRKNFWSGEHPVRDDRRSLFTMEPLSATPAYRPLAGWHVNDHCFVRYRGKWHMYGIVAPNPGVKGPAVMNYLGAAVSDCLACTDWKEAPPPFYDPVERGAVLWAPYIVRAKGLFWIFYCAGGDPEKFGIACRTSADLVHWSDRTILFREGYQARDPMVMWLEAEKRWVLYYASTERNEGGHYVVAYRISDDLIHWSGKKIAYTDEHSGSDYGDTESPFVVKRGGSYYLFTGPRPYDHPTDSLPNNLHPGYVGTDVFRSSRWDHFENAGYVGHLPVHAPEIVKDTDGQWYISHGGMTQGGLYITRLKWNDTKK